MTQFIGSAGSEIISGTVGLADEFVTAAAQTALEFRWNGTSSWIVTGGGQGTDTLTSVETITMADAAFTLGVGGETRANTSTLTSQTPAVIGLAGGGHVVVWAMTGTSADASSYGIFAQRYNAAGEAVGGETLVNTYITSNQTEPVAVALGTGGYAIVWSSAGQDGSSGGVYMQRYDASGAPLGAEQAVNMTTLDHQSDASVTLLSNGAFIVSWTSNNQDGDGNGTYFQRFSSSGTPAGPETQINTTIAGAQHSTALAATGNGFVAAWMSDGQGLVLQRFGATGSKVGGEIVVGTATVSGSPVIASTANGFILAWTEGADIHAQLFALNGSAVGEEFTVNTTTDSTQFLPAVTALADGGFAVTWAGFNAENSTYEVYLQRLDAGGGRVGIETVVNQTTAGAQTNPAIAALADGGFAVTWINQGLTYSQRYSADGAAVLPSVTGDLNNNTIDARDATTPVRLEGGDGNDSLTGGSAGDVLAGGSGADVMRGGAGDDFYLADAADWINEGLGAGVDTVQASESFTLTRNVDNLTLVGDAAATLIGNALDNVLVGNAAANRLNGRGGADTMRGGLGNDTYFVDNVGDSAIEESGAGIDSVIAETTFALSANVENLRLIGTSNIDAAGNALDNILTGNAGANQLTGAGGADTLAGGEGNDTYFVDALDLVIEDADEGIDMVVASTSWVLGSDLESLQLLAGGAYNGTGNELANVLYGNSSSNVLDGGGGADIMDGGDGNDTYFVDDVGDVASESSASTNDTVNSTATHTLGSGIENLTLLGTANLDGFGNWLNNTLRGNSGANQLGGGDGDDRLYGGNGHDTLAGGFGSDTLYGGGGNDLYLMTDENDDIVELGGQGIDTVQASGVPSYALDLNVENLVLVGGNIAGYGNALDNQITGTAGNNLLDGGAGADVLAGLTGNDTYVVDTSGDTVVEGLDAGTDLVLSSIALTLAENVENLTLTGTAAINGTGNVLGNQITGNNASNTLAGGSGNDTVIGAGGNDVLNGSNGKDVLNGGTGNDVMDGGGGTDTATYFGISGGVVVNLATTAAQNTLSAGSDRLTGIEDLEGSNSGGDTLTGNALGNRLNGNGGNDTLTGAGGNDTLNGGEGDDLILADAGDDRIDGGNGADLLSFAAATTGVTVDLSLTGAQDTGLGLDTIRNVEIVEGSIAAGDSLTGDHQANTLLGLAGNDRLAGGEGGDTLDGGAGLDTADYGQAYGSVAVDLSAGFAFDDGSGSVDVLTAIERLVGSEFDDALTGSALSNQITGGLGRDVMTGQGGNDVFILRSAVETGITATTRDIVTDFAAGDKIDLSNVDADTGTAGLQDFASILTPGTAFTAAGQLRLQNGVLFGNTDGDAQAEFMIELTGVTSLTLADFVL